MALELLFELTLHSDYHVSAGHGLGPDVDSALHRDVDGVPILRGTTLTGLLRDGLARLQQTPVLAQKNLALCRAFSGQATGPVYCGEHEQPTSAEQLCPGCRIFGSPRTPRRWRISSARPTEAPALGGHEWRAGETGATIAPHVRVSPRTRRAEARKLFFREEGDRALIFRFSVTCGVPDADALGQAEWLVAAARSVRHLGAGRRRGRGECEINLVDARLNGQPLTAAVDQATPTVDVQEWFIQRFAADQLAGKSPARLTTAAQGFTSSQAAGGPVTVLVVARLDEPLLIANKGEAGNEFYGVDHIPGSSLRGAFAGRIAAAHDLSKTDSAAYAAFVRLILNGDVRFTPLYPAHHANTRLLPTIPAPLDLLSCELYPGVNPGHNHNLSHGATGYVTRSDRDPKCEICGEAPDEEEVGLKPVADYWALREGADHVKPALLSEMHVHIDPHTGRAAAGDLFGFSTLAPGQYFVGLVHAASQRDWADLAALADLPPTEGDITLRMGKASRRGYGKTSLHLKQWTQRDVLRQVPLASRMPAVDKLFTMTLLSDTILVDAWGRGYRTITTELLRELLKLPVEVKRAFTASHPKDAFNTHLGLPRWRDTALVAGSAFGIKVDADVALMDLQSALEALERDGIGLRRNEGFGQVAFNHPLYYNCGGLRGSGLDAPTFGTQPQAATERQAQQKQLDEWRKTLAELPAKKWEPFQHPESGPLARWLAVTPPASVDAFREQVAALGLAGQDALAPDLTQELAVWWDRKQLQYYFRKPEGQAVIAATVALLKLLLKVEPPVAEGGAVWAAGVRLLAERIASAARAAEAPGGRRNG